MEDVCERRESGNAVRYYLENIILDYPILQLIINQFGYEDEVVQFIFK